jgi:hypothetical protein
MACAWEQRLFESGPEPVGREFLHALEPAATLAVAACAPNRGWHGMVKLAIRSVASHLSTGIRRNNRPAESGSDVERPAIVGEDDVGEREERDELRQRGLAGEVDDAVTVGLFLPP